MTLTITEVKLPQSKYSIKCPFSMTPQGITMHNTANDASAMAEISYMQGNPHEVSFHYAVDDTRAVQGLPLNRNGWHAGDGGSGKGNRTTIGVEICYSKSGGTSFIKAEKNAAELVARILKSKGWGINRVGKHQDYWQGTYYKYCPHRTLDLGWQRFLNMVQNELNKLNGTTTVTQPKAEVKPTTPTPKPVTKTIDQLADEVIAGKHGTGDARKKALGSQYDAVQKRVNEKLGATVKPKVTKKTNAQIAREIYNGVGNWGTGQTRIDRLRKAGYDPVSVQREVNKLF